jgi:excisionase family DNA binding protein
MARHMLNANEAAEYLKISYWTLLEKAKKGLIPCVRISSRVLFSEEGLTEWVAQMEKASVAQPEQAAQYGTLRRIKG